MNFKEREGNWKHAKKVITAGVKKSNEVVVSTPLPKTNTFTYAPDAWELTRKGKERQDREKKNFEDFYKQAVEKQRKKLPHPRDFDLKDDYIKAFNAIMAPYITSKEFEKWLTKNKR